MESISLDETIRCASKWFILTQRMQNLEVVNHKFIAYAQPIRLFLTCTYCQLPSRENLEITLFCHGKVIEFEGLEGAGTQKYLFLTIRF